MSKLKIGNEWWTAPAEAANGQLIMVTGRRDMEPVMAMGVYVYRVEVTWRYEGDAHGMPDEATSQLMEQAHDALCATFDRDPVAVLTGIYTGDGERNWVFYLRSLHIFQRKFNEALAGIPALKLEFDADEDPEWLEYQQMCEARVDTDKD